LIVLPGYFSDRLRRTGRAPRNLTAGYILKKDTPTVGKKSNTGQEFKVYTDWTRRKSEPFFFFWFFFFIIIFFYETVKRNNKTQNSAKTTSYVAFILSSIFIPIFAFFFYDREFVYTFIHSFFFIPPPILMPLYQISEWSLLAVCFCSNPFRICS
jgi:hypothetical protein